jgi:hypothetical protein
MNVWNATVDYPPGAHLCRAPSPTVFAYPAACAVRALGNRSFEGALALASLGARPCRPVSLDTSLSSRLCLQPTTVCKADPLCDCVRAGSSLSAQAV